MLALVPAAVITVALVSYGLIGIEIIVRALVQGTVSWAQVAGDWAVSATEVIFLFWGAALGIATWGYYLASRHPSGPTAVPSVQETRSAH